MSFLELKSLRKVFPGGTEAVRGVDLDVEEGEFVVLLGPSGCGKTTTLRMIAGLETPTSGQVRLEGEDMTRLRPARRDIGFVFQFYTLYPHMTVRANLEFPLENIGTPRRERARLVAETAEQMGLAHLLDRRPGRLTGGERQMVSVARAMIRRPRLWLMDEPLGAIDASQRVELREWIRARQLDARVTTIYVTHDQEEAMSLADRVVVMNEGRIEQADAPLRVYDEPASLFAAHFIGSPGMNLLDGRVETENGRAVFRLDSGRAAVPLPGAPAPGPAVLGVRSEFVHPHPQGEIEAVVAVDEFQGAFRNAYLDVGQERRLVMRLPPDQPLAADARVRVRIDPERIRLFDPQTGRRR